MRKLFLVTFFIVAAFGAGLAVQTGSTTNTTDSPNMGQAPTGPNGIGRADVRVVDESGNPVKGAYAKLESRRTDGYYCESWNTTNAQGVAVLPPIHIGTLRLVVKAHGYQTQRLDVAATSLSDPVKVTLARKK